MFITNGQNIADAVKTFADARYGPHGFGMIVTGMVMHRDALFAQVVDPPLELGNRISRARGVARDIEFADGSRLSFRSMSMSEREFMGIRPHFVWCHDSCAVIQPYDRHNILTMLETAYAVEGWPEQQRRDNA